MDESFQPNYGTQPVRAAEPYPVDILASLRTDAERICARYPQKRSALLPLLHLVQSVDGYVSTRGIELCADVLDLTAAEVSGVATFYTQYDETTDDGKITLERIECNAACDYAPVVMTNWEFFDNMTPEATIALVDDLRAGKPAHPTRGAQTVATFKEISRVLAGFPDGRHDEGVGAGGPSLAGLTLAHERGWTAPGQDHHRRAGDGGGASSGDVSPTGTTVDAEPKTGEKYSSSERSGPDERKTTS